MPGVGMKAPDAAARPESSARHLCQNSPGLCDEQGLRCREVSIFDGDAGLSLMADTDAWCRARNCLNHFDTHQAIVKFC